ncbi:MAG: ABC transporter permease subunit, partial [Actinomycetota bacterium]|nr:ABC transporter permease subunit [Actinomycetota bacterium]
AIWEIIARAGRVSSTLFPPISTIFVALWDNIVTGDILKHLWYSLYLIFIGIGIGMVLTFILTALYMVYKPFANILDVVISIMHPLPGIALLPVIMLIVGLGAKAIIIVIIQSVIWPVMVNSIAGFRSIPGTQIELGRNIGMSEFRLVWSVMIPNAFPHIFAGLKIAWSRSWRALIGAEMIFGATGLIGGLGWYIYKKKYFLEIPDVYAGLLVIVAIGIIVEELVMNQIEKRTIVKWGVTV